MKNKSMFFYFGQNYNVQITKPIWKHFYQIQIFVCLSELNLALRAENSEQPSRCHFSIYYLLYYIRLFDKPYVNEVTLTEQNLPLKCCQPLEILPHFTKGLNLLLLNIWGLNVKGLQSCQLSKLEVSRKSLPPGPSPSRSSRPGFEFARGRIILKV